MDTPSSALSLLQGSTDHELWQKSLGTVMDEQASLYEDRPAVIVPWQSARLSFRQLADRSWIVAEALFEAGLRRGDCVGVLAGNRYEYLEVFLGAGRLGCPVVVLNNTYTLHELQNALRTTRKSLIANSQISPGRLVARTYQALGCEILFVAPTIGPRSMERHVDHLQQVGSSAELPDLQRLVVFGETKGSKDGPLCQSYETFTTDFSTDGLKVRRAAKHVKPEDVINLQFTSGKCLM